MRSLGDSDPSHVGPYRVLAGLDADELGPLLLATTVDSRLVAIKLVGPRLAADDGFRPRLLQQASALRQLSAGAHVAPVVDGAPTDPTPWLAADFQPGLPLSQVIERGVLLGEDDLLRLAAGLASALAGRHRAGLPVHGDLTPVNVLLTEDGVRLLDFGVARAVDPDARIAVTAEEVMSPELAGARPVVPASDIFSLGALLHLAATGRSPFAGATRGETLTNITHAPPDLSGSLPSRIRQLLTACLAKDPLQRPTPDQLLAVIGPLPPALLPWPALVRTLLVQQHTEITQLRNTATSSGQPAVDAPTMRIAPVTGAATPPRPRTPQRPRTKRASKRWKPDRWAVISGAAVVATIVFAVVMFNALTPDRPIRASQQESTRPSTTSSAPTTTTTTTTTTTSTTTTTTTTTTAPQPVSGRVVGLASKCMDVAGANAANGTQVQLHTCNGTNAQQWVFGTDGTIRGLGKCLDVAGASTADGAPVQINDCTGGAAQQWVLTSAGWIINVPSNKCLDIPASTTTDGTPLTIWTCHGEPNQVWSAPA